MTLRIELTNGERPTWLKDDDVVVRRTYANGFWSDTNRPQAGTAKHNIFAWGYDLVAIEIEDTHPYAVATRAGYAYNDGNSEREPKDREPGSAILFRCGYISSGTGWSWRHQDSTHDIIGYIQKAETNEYLVSTNVKFRVTATDEADAQTQAKDKLEADDLIGTYGGICVKLDDPDRQAARDICALNLEDRAYNARAAQYRAGACDDQPFFTTTLAGIKHGRTLGHAQV